jgi:hypothetical protein
MKVKREYITNCVASTAAKINDMVDRAREIKIAAFKRNTNWQEWALSLGYDGRPLYLHKDYHVRFYISRYEGKRCYFCVQSGIEWIFV